MDFFESLASLKQKLSAPPEPKSEDPVIPEPIDESAGSSDDILQWLDSHGTESKDHPLKAAVSKPSTKKSEPDRDRSGALQEALKKAAVSHKRAAEPPFVKEPEVPQVGSETASVSPEPSDPEEWLEEFHQWDHEIDIESYFIGEPEQAPAAVSGTSEPEDPFADPDDHPESAEILDHLNRFGISLKAADFAEKRRRGEEGVHRTKGAVEKTIDLHGMAVRDAELKIIQTFDESKIRGYQQILIIHGKGNHSSGGDSKMKRMVVDLLEGSLADRVASFTYAPYTEGGSGAARVILK